MNPAPTLSTRKHDLIVDTDLLGCNTVALEADINISEKHTISTYRSIYSTAIQKTNRHLYCHRNLKSEDLIQWQDKHNIYSKRNVLKLELYSLIK
jgi:hypothetical protein